MKNKEFVLETLRKWKFPVMAEEDNWLVFRYQLNVIRIWFQCGENGGVAVSLGGLFTADNEKEVAMAYKVCNALSAKIMQVKLYLDDDFELVIASEFYFRTREELEYFLDISCRGLINAKKQFLAAYGEAEENQMLIDELNKE
ncbi:MAG: hypothetical protein OSJ37_07905 [Muribaculaceae bacterium]|nr:hypothetical protein [Muribaculaceae bacterium]